MHATEQPAADVAPSADALGVAQAGTAKRSKSVGQQAAVHSITVHAAAAAGGATTDERLPFICMPSQRMHSRDEAIPARESRSVGNQYTLSQARSHSVRSMMRSGSNGGKLMRALGHVRSEGPRRFWPTALQGDGGDAASDASAEEKPEGSRRWQVGTVGEGGRDLLCTLHALQDVCDVHSTDEGMQNELALPFPELNEVRHCIADCSEITCATRSRSCSCVPLHV